MVRRSTTWALTGALTLAVSCGRAPAVQATESTTTPRARIAHPTGWTVAVQPGRNEGLFMDNIEVTGPSSARIFITVYDAQAPFAAEDVASLHLPTLARELGAAGVSVVDSRPITAQVAGESSVGTELSVSTTTHPSADYIVRAFTRKTPTRTASVVTQVEARDQPAAQPALDLVVAELAILQRDTAGPGWKHH